MRSKILNARDSQQASLGAGFQPARPGDQKLSLSQRRLGAVSFWEAGEAFHLEEWVAR